MANKYSLIILGGMLGVGTIGGTTLALYQRSVNQQSPQPSASVQQPALSQQSQPPQAISRSSPPSGAQASLESERPSPRPDSSNPSLSEANKADRRVTRCRILMAIVNDPAPPLNVRTLPNTTGKVVGTLPDGAYVSVKQEENGWFEITEPAGWIAKSKTVSRCGEKVEQVQFATGNVRAQIADEFVGAGSHRYQLQLQPGQTLSLKSEVGPTPALIAPNGQYLIGMDQQPQGWQQQLSKGGTYTLEMDSNFRGYKYDFTIEAQ